MISTAVVDSLRILQAADAVAVDNQYSDKGSNYTVP